MQPERIALWLIAPLCAAVAALSLAKGGAAHRLRRALWAAACALAALMLILLACYLAAQRFDVAYVAGHTSRDLPLVYRVSALWAGQEGSFLLWLAILLPMGLLLRSEAERSAMGVYALIALLLSVMTAVSDPFARLAAPPADGVGLSQALQDPWMISHPPLVFVGYSAMAALASYAALGAVSSGTDGASPAKLRLLLRLSFVFLGLGIFTGSVWAYRALGWGGFWAWDPIENAALVPWLILCGYLHDPKPATPLRRAIPFALACLGTFLTRSGALKDASAHAYTDGDGIVAALLLALLSAAILFALLLAVRGRLSQANAGRGPLIDLSRLSGGARRRSPGAQPAPQPPDGHDRRTPGQAQPQGAFSLLLCRGSSLGMRIFARASYAFAALILIGTLLPLFTGFATPTAIYDALSVLYALVCTALMLLRDGELLLRKGYLALLVNTAIVFALMMALTAVNAAALVVLWLLFLPLSLFAVGLKKPSAYSFTHAALALLIVGAFAASALSSPSMAVASASSPFVTVGNQAVETAALVQHDSVIVFSPLSDYIVYGSQAVSNGSDVLVPYTAKPLILFFWVGGFALLASSLWRLVNPPAKRRPVDREEESETAAD